MHVTHVNHIHLHLNIVISFTLLEGTYKKGLVILVVTSCTQYKKDIKHIGLSIFLQPPQYLIIIVNRFGNNDGMTKIKQQHD